MKTKGHATHRRMSYAVPGSKYVNVMVVTDKKGGTNISLAP